MPVRNRPVYLSSFSWQLLPIAPHLLPLERPLTFRATDPNREDIMSQSLGWRRLLLCAVLEFAALSGAPLRPKDIEDALRPRSEITSQEVCRKENDEKPVRLE